MAHELDPLLRPRSIAVVGASKRKHSMGQWSLENLRRGGFEGAVYPLNPGHEEIDGLKCYGTFAELPEIPDLAIFAVGDQRIEQALDAAIDKGVRAAVIMSSLCIDDDVEPALKERVRQKVTAANLLVCGANGMGFYNFRDNTWCCGFDSRHHDPGERELLDRRERNDKYDDPRGCAHGRTGTASVEHAVESWAGSIQLPM